MSASVTSSLRTAGGTGDSHWDLDRIVADLGSSRAAARPNQRRNGIHHLPSREALARVVERLFAVLFPAHFGPPELSEEGIDYFVGQTLDASLTALREQVHRELALSHAREAGDREARAIEITRAFAATLPAIRNALDKDIQAAYDGDPAALSIDEVLFCYPGITAVTHYRLAHALHRLGVPLLARIISERAHSATGIDIHPAAEIGASFFIDHGTGVVIGATAVIGERVRLYQAVTLGAKRFAVDDQGTLVKGVPRHPILEDDVVIYAGATILGRVTIGRGSTIGGNVWLTRSVPPGSNITQAQARNEAFEGGAGI